ncbi:MAG: dockerin type I domain-containing protein, partial [Candidatus Paceibacterota bacterium]
TNTPTPAPESLLIPLATYVKNSGKHRITKLKAQICLKDDPNSCAQTASENVPPNKLHPGDVNLWYGIEIPKVNNTDEFQLYMWADFVGDVTPIEQVFPSQFRGFPGNMRALINHGRPVQLWYEGIDAESDQSEFADISQAVDIDNNACINSIDASLIIKNYFEESTEEKQLDEDVNLDGIVNGMDFSYLNAYWGQGDDCAYNSPSLQNFTFE